MGLQESTANESDDGDVGPYSNDRVAQRYEQLAREGKLSVRERKVLGRYFEPGPGTRVLDLGCGTGRTTRHLHDCGFDVVGVDASEPMVERGRALFGDLDIRLGDATDLGFDADTFDYVLFSYVGLDAIRPEADRIRALEEIHRVLKPRGLFAFSSHNALYNFPALAVDHSHLVNFYLANENLGNLFDRYKTDGDEFGVKWYLSHPLRQIQQLRRCGFELVSIVGKRDGVGRYFERQPYYVARKPRH